MSITMDALLDASWSQCVRKDCRATLSGARRSKAPSLIQIEFVAECETCKVGIGCKHATMEAAIGRFQMERRRWAVGWKAENGCGATWITDRTQKRVAPIHSLSCDDCGVQTERSSNPCVVVKSFAEFECKGRRKGGESNNNGKEAVTASISYTASVPYTARELAAGVVTGEAKNPSREGKAEDSKSHESDAKRYTAGGELWFSMTEEEQEPIIRAYSRSLSVDKSEPEPQKWFDIPVLDPTAAPGLYNEANDTDKSCRLDDAAEMNKTEPRRVRLLQVVQTQNGDLLYYAVAEDGTMWYAPVREGEGLGAWMQIQELPAKK